VVLTLPMVLDLQPVPLVPTVLGGPVTLAALETPPVLRGPSVRWHLWRPSHPPSHWGPWDPEILMLPFHRMVPLIQRVPEGPRDQQGPRALENPIPLESLEARQNPMIPGFPETPEVPRTPGLRSVLLGPLIQPGRWAPLIRRGRWGPSRLVSRAVRTLRGSLGGRLVPRAPMVRETLTVL